MTEISRLQATQPLSDQPITPEQPEPKVSFKGEPDSFERTSSSNKDVAVATTAGAAAGVIGAKPLYEKLAQFLGHFGIDQLFADASKEDRKNAHKELNKDIAETKKDAADLKEAAKKELEELQETAKKADKELQEAAEEAKPALQKAAEKAKAEADEAANALKLLEGKVPAKYRVIAAAAGAAVIGGVYAIGKLLVGGKKANAESLPPQE
jgi:septum formation inhibitor MinC